jgi:hypothetical protein
MTAALCNDATCLAACSTSTDKLHERVCAPFTVTAVGTAMMAAQLVTFFMIAFWRLPWMARLVSRMVETRSRSDSVHSVARSTWS